MKNNKGFSLVELIVVIAIMAILAAVAIPTFATFIDKANEAADESYLNDLEYAITLALATENDVDDYVLTISVADNDDTDTVVNNVTYTLTKGEGEDATTYVFTDEQKADIAATVELTHTFKSEKAAGSWALDDKGEWEFKPAANNAG